MLLRHYGGYCITKQGTREETTTCEECLHSNLPIKQCIDKLLDQKIKENVDRLNALFNFRKSHEH